MVEALMEQFPDKMRKNERKIILEKIAGEKARRADGTVDSTLFTGENSLIAVFDPETNMWGLRYEKGILPGYLNGHRFTQFGLLKTYVENYYLNRGVRIKEIED